MIEELRAVPSLGGPLYDCVNANYVQSGRLPARLRNCELCPVWADPNMIEKLRPVPSLGEPQYDCENANCAQSGRILV